MKIRFILVGLLLFVLPVHAQDELAELQRANQNSLNQNSYQFDYAFVFASTGAGPEPINVDLSGQGQIDLDAGLLQISMDGTASVGADQMPLRGEIRVIEGQILANVFDPTVDEETGWLGVRAEDLEVLSDLLTGAFEQGFNEEGGNLSIEALDPAILTELTGALSTIRPEAFVTLSHGDDVFSLDVDLSELVTEDGFEEGVRLLYDAFGTTFDPAAQPLSDAELAAALAFLGVLLEDTTLSVDQTVDLEVDQVLVTTVQFDSSFDLAEIDAGTGVANIESSLNVELSGYGESFALTVPEDTLFVPRSVLELAAEEFEPAPEIDPPAILEQPTPAPIDPQVAPPAENTIAIGEQTVVVVPEGEPDTVSLSVQGSGTVTITASSVTPGQVDTTLELRDTAGNVIANNDDHGSELPNLGRYDSAIQEVVLDGSATLIVGRFGITGGDVSISVIGDAGVASTPADGTMALSEPQVITIVDGEPVTLPLDIGSAVVTITASSAEGSNVDPILTIYDENGNEIASNDDHGTEIAGLGLFDAAITNLSLSGPVAVEVSSFGLSTGDVNVVISAGEDVDTAPPIVDTTFTGFANGETPVTHQFNGNAGDVITVTLVAINPTSPELDMRLTLFDPSGEQLASNDDHTTSIDGLGLRDAAVEGFELPTTGEYTVEVHTWFGEAGEYRLEVR